ncbi:MAG: class I SAM-dependent methyltransferase [Proteobacteria bacterium]|nr:class I SAM-dependent methyltransferase [Pseudomonadota bacterium]
MTPLLAEKHESDAPLQQRIDFHYSNLADWIDTRPWYHDDRVVKAVMSCISGQPTRILELCCGSGLLLEALGFRLPDAVIVGVDISSRMTQLARARVADKDNLSVRTGNWIYQMPQKWSRQPFDVIVVKNALHLLHDLPKKLRDLRDVSHSRTTLIIVETDHIKQSYFTRISLRKALRSSGWEMASIRPKFVRQRINVVDWLVHQCDDLMALEPAKRVLRTKDNKVRKTMEFDSVRGEIPAHMLRLQYIASHMLHPLDTKLSHGSENQSTQLSLVHL